MRPAVAVAITVLWVTGSGAALAQSASFPVALERERLLVWLQRETDILPDQVVAVTPQALTSIMSRFPAGAGSGPRLVIRAEALSPELQARTGALSWHVSLNADCENRLIKLGETTGYAERNLLGARKMLRATETNWREPEAGSAVEQAWRAACEPEFMGPFRSSAVKLADVDAPSATPATVTDTAPARQRDAPVASAVTRVAPPPTAKADKPVRGPAPSRPGPAVQLAAVTSDAAARALITALKGRLAGHATWVESADVAGRTWFRAMAGGFASVGEAARFCAGLKASGQSCFVRPGG